MKSKISKKKGVGRPHKIIDWDFLEEHLIAGCNGAEVAAQLGVHADTLYRAVESKFDMNFTDFAASKHAKGCGLLRLAQYKKAIGQSDLGDNTLLIWLGKCRLKQKENQEVTFNARVEENFEKIMLHFTNQQEMVKKEIDSKVL